MTEMRRRITRRVTGAEPALPADLHPVLRQVYAARHVRDAAELDHSLARLQGFEQLGHVTEAAALLADLIARDAYLLVVGDYDADGATATALAVRGLTAFGAGRVEYLVPDRFRHGYGLGPGVVELALELGPDAIITVDNGISSIEGVAMARREGMEVIITDHHLPGECLPDASVIVNPNLPDDPFPSKVIAGVGVMFYLLAALRAELRRRDWFASRGLSEPNLAGWLDLVALGTVADVVALDQNNRILVSHGLELIRRGRCVPGITALLGVAGRDPRRIVAADIGFAVGPRLNAAGRLTDMSLGIECLISDDVDACDRMARQLDDLNRERQEIQQSMQDQALIALDSLADTASGKEGYCLHHPDWHQGVIGILASRIKDRVQRPVIAFAPDDSGGLKGSARSIPGIHIRDVIDRIATLAPGLVRTFGGHAMAAGLTIEEAGFDEFARRFDAEVGRLLAESGVDADIHSDGELEGRHMNLDTAELLRAAGPWGQGFPEPVFDGLFEILDRRIVGEQHLKLKLRRHDGLVGIDAIAFNTTGADWPGHVRTVTAAYRLDVNEFMGRRTAQLIIEYLEPVDGQTDSR